MTAVFPAIVPTISGEVTLRKLIRIWEHYKHCAQLTETAFDAQNFLYIILLTGIWPYFLTPPYPTAPGNPGTNPSYNSAEDATANTTICDVWQLEHKNFEEHKHINSGLVGKFLKIIPDTNCLTFKTNQLTVNPKLTFLAVFDYFGGKFAMATEAEIIKNTAKLLNPWQPHEGMEVLIDWFYQKQIYTFFSKNLMDDKVLINYSLMVIKRMGKYMRAYKDWLAEPDTSKTYAHLKDFWRI